jgi:protein-disulfide isomerase
MFPVTQSDHIRGSRGSRGSLDAPVTLVEYGDFECPHCRRAHPIVEQLLVTLGDQLCFAFRNFPLTQIHPHAERAAEAAEAADALTGPDAYWGMHGTLFENQEALEDEDLLRYAQEIGLDAAAFARALQTGQFVPRVTKDFLGGVRSGVNGTPTFFINGERFDGDWTDVRVFSSVLLNAQGSRLKAQSSRL